MRKLGVEEWLVNVVKSMYANAKSKVHLGFNLSEYFNIKVGVHQGSVLSPLLFAIVMEALSREFRISCPWELLYADDLVISADSIEELLQRFQLWKENLALKGLKVNMKKTKVLYSRYVVSQKEKSRFLCGVCNAGVGRNSILCNKCTQWIHHKCTNIKVLREDPSFKCKKCRNEVVPVGDKRPEKVEIGGDTLDVVKSFCYLGDTIHGAK